jgi:phage anti-repressor protein
MKKPKPLPERAATPEELAREDALYQQAMENKREVEWAAWREEVARHAVEHPQPAADPAPAAHDGTVSSSKAAPALFVMVEHRGEIQPLVNARAFHDFLAIRRKFSAWFSKAVAGGGYQRDRDFVIVGNPADDSGATLDYLLSADMAKALAQKVSSRKGRAAARKFPGELFRFRRFGDLPALPCENPAAQEQEPAQPPRASSPKKRKKPPMTPMKEPVKVIHGWNPRHESLSELPLKRLYLISLNGETHIVVNARDIHSIMKVPTPFGDWFRNIAKSGEFIRNRDYMIVDSYHEPDKMPVTYLLFFDAAEYVVTHTRNASAAGKAFLEEMRREIAKTATNEGKTRPELPDLIPVFTGELGEWPQLLVNARDLYEYLGAKQRFPAWVKQQIKRFKLTENLHYDAPAALGPLGYRLTLDSAKHIAVNVDGERGATLRDYFIECERRLYVRQTVLIPPPAPDTLDASPAAPLRASAEPEPASAAFQPGTVAPMLPLASGPADPEPAEALPSPAADPEFLPVADLIPALIPPDADQAPIPAGLEYNLKLELLMAKPVFGDIRHWYFKGLPPTDIATLLKKPLSEIVPIFERMVAVDLLPADFAELARRLAEQPGKKRAKAKNPARQTESAVPTPPKREKKRRTDAATNPKSDHGQ